MIDFPNSIYIHIPFCKTKCPYCDFASWANKENLIDEYFHALFNEVATKCEAYKSFGKKSDTLSKIKTVFIGGGTPSLVDSIYYKKLFTELKKYFYFEEDCEITLELNPGTANPKFLEGYFNLGINRISIGAQNFDETTLITLGRKHSIEETIFAIESIKKVGFTNFNLDLIFSVPGLTPETWKNSIETALSFNPTHISSYSLIIEPNTPFELIYKDKNLLPTDEIAYEMYLILCNKLKKNGFEHYEISNFAIPGYESKHNLVYWNSEEYFAFGTNAHRFLNNIRTNNLRGFDEYISNPNIEIINYFPESPFYEKAMLKSRLKKGLSISEIRNASSKNDSEIKLQIQILKDEKLIEYKNNIISLTDKGMFLNNEILLKLL